MSKSRKQTVEEDRDVEADNPATTALFHLQIRDYFSWLLATRSRGQRILDAIDREFPGLASVGTLDLERVPYLLQASRYFGSEWQRTLQSKPLKQNQVGVSKQKKRKGVDLSDKRPARKVRSSRKLVSEQSASFPIKTAGKNRPTDKVSHENLPLQPQKDVAQSSFAKQRVDSPNRFVDKVSHEKLQPQKDVAQSSFAQQRVDSPNRFADKVSHEKLQPQKDVAQSSFAQQRVDSPNRFADKVSHGKIQPQKDVAQSSFAQQRVDSPRRFSDKVSHENFPLQPQKDVAQSSFAKQGVESMYGWATYNNIAPHSRGSGMETGRPSTALNNQGSIEEITRLVGPGFAGGMSVQSSGTSAQAPAFASMQQHAMMNYQQMTRNNMSVQSQFAGQNGASFSQFTQPNLSVLSDFVAHFGGKNTMSQTISGNRQPNTNMVGFPQI